MKPIDAYIFGVLVNLIGDRRRGISLRESDICETANVGRLQLIVSLKSLKKQGIIDFVFFGEEMVAVSPIHLALEEVKDLFPDISHPDEYREWSATKELRFLAKEIAARCSAVSHFGDGNCGYIINEVIRALMDAGLYKSNSKTIRVVRVEK